MTFWLMVMLGSCACLFAVALLGFIFPKFGHRVFGWHHVTEILGFDGASQQGQCTICGKKCLQDSQGNWF